VPSHEASFRGFRDVSRDDGAGFRRDVNDDRSWGGSDRGSAGLASVSHVVGEIRSGVDGCGGSDFVV